MKSTLLAGLALSLAAALPVHAHDYLSGGMHIEHPWARPTAPGAPNGAAYLTLHEHGDGNDKLVSASSPVAAKVELHTNEMDGGVMKMRSVESIAVEQGVVTQLKPGGLHLMLMQGKGALREGQAVPLRLQLEGGDEAGATLTVRKAAP